MDISTIGTAFASFFKGVPAVVWSGLVGAFIALLGVLVANKGQANRQAQQLKHDAEQKEKDRLIAMRREVYLKLPPATVKVANFLAELPSIDLSKMSASALAEYAEIAAQVQIICELDTAEEVERLGVMYAKRLVQSMQELDELQDVKTDIELKDQRLAETQAELDQVIDAMKQVNRSSVPPDPALWNKLNLAAERHMAESAELREVLNNLRARKQRLMAEYHKREAARPPALKQQQIKVVAALRKEIGLTHDLADYLSRIEPLAKELTETALGAMESWAVELEEPSSQMKQERQSPSE